MGAFERYQVAEDWGDAAAKRFAHATATPYDVEAHERDAWNKSWGARYRRAFRDRWNREVGELRALGRPAPDDEELVRLIGPEPKPRAKRTAKDGKHAAPLPPTDFGPPPEPPPEERVRTGALAFVKLARQGMAESKARRGK